MQSTGVVFKFDGADAARHRMDPAVWIAHETAARQLLGLFAYFLATDRIPNGGIPSHLPGKYNVYVTGRSQGSIEGHWIVELFAVEALKATLGYGFRKGADHIYKHFLRDSIGSMLGTRSDGVPPHQRREPVFEPLDRNNTPFIDIEGERAHRWDELQGRGASILESAARPIIRGQAETMTIRAANDNDMIAMITMAELCRLQNDAFAWRRAQITAALGELRKREQ